MWWYDGMGWGGWVAMMLSMVVFWSLLFYGLLAIVRAAGDSGVGARATGTDPLEVLDERFARGEIDVDEYHARQEVLRHVH